MPDFFDAPILNSPYEAPCRHWDLDAEGRPTGTITKSRRRAEFVAAVPGAVAEAQFEMLDLDDLTDEAALQTAIGEVRAEVDRWRALPNPLDWQVTAETRQLLQHWRNPDFEGLRPFFCQVEAVEIAIWLAEVAPLRARTKRLLDRLRDVNEAANPGLFRLALKLATGAGKTTVMAMLIAWQTINAVRSPKTRSYTKGFLIVAPGITIRDRLRVLLPNDPDSSNTVASELVCEYISGYHRTDEREQTDFFHAHCELFSNFDGNGDPVTRPRTLLIDSIQIEKGDSIDDAFRKAASEEIDRFRRDKIIREGSAAAEKITDAELLREAMNTVGRKGRLGEQIRCVVSVGMLTEGWDANTVTHILGLRAFGSRLLCEQVMGRALRRLSYDLHDTPDGPRYGTEYADIMGIDGLNLAPQDAVTATPVPPRRTVRVEAVSPDRDACEIRFPRVEGYRVELPDTAIAADWSKIEPYILTTAKVGPCEVEMRGVVGAPERLTLDHLREVRDNEIILKLTGHLVFHKLRDGEDRPIASLIPKIKPIVRRFLDEFVECRGGTVKAQLMHLQLADEVAGIILGAINMHHAGTEDQPIRAVLAPYTPVGSTLDVGFNTATDDKHWANPLRSHVNWIVWDGTWERNLAERLDTHPQVIAYVKNHALGFEVPYRSGNEPRRYRPDFIVRIDDGQGGEINLVLEVKGFRDHDAMLKATTIRTQWVPGVNRLGRFGRWSFAELREIHDFGPALDRAIADAIAEARAEAPA